MKKQMTYSDKNHLIGRIFLAAAVIIILLVPIAMAIVLKAAQILLK